MECFKCLKEPQQLAEYIEGAKEYETTPEEYVKTEEGTYNPETNTFCCTDCYIKIGMPSKPSPDCWKAPAPGRSQ